jgi:thiamine biosynthesis protein ThiC
MTNIKKKTKTTKAQLQRKVRELEAQMASTYHFAAAALPKCGDGMMGSGVLVHLSPLGGGDLVMPFVIRDGLSAATIAALNADIIRSYELATALQPKSTS